MDKTGKSRLFRSLKLVRRRKGKIGAILLLGLFVLMFLGSMSVPISGNEVSLSYAPLEPVKTFAPAAPTQVVFTAAGAGDSGTTTTLTPSYPSVTEGDLLFCVIVVNSATSSVSSVTDFTSYIGPMGMGDTINDRAWVYYRYAEGDESGTVTATRTAGAYGWGCRIFGFENVHQTIGSAIENLTYVNLGTTDTVLDTAVETSGTLELAVNMIFVGDDSNNPVDMVGESGGDWTQVTTEYEWNAGNDGAIDVQTAIMATSGTIDGGGGDWGNADPYGNLGFALMPEDGGGTAYEKDMIEGVSAVDVQTNTADFVRDFTEAVSSVDVITTAADMVRNLVESVGVVGVLTMLRGREKDLVETITASDVLTNTGSFVRDFNESVSAVDTISKVVGVNMTEAITAADTIEIYKAVVKDMVETITVSYVTSKDIGKNMSESISAIDAQSNAAAYVRDFVEAITAASVQTNTADFARDLTESINVVDTIDAHIVGGPIEKNLTESINVSPVSTTVGGRDLFGSLIYQLFFSLDMWGYLGPIALVIGGYIVAKKDKSLGVLWFVVEALIIANYLTLVSATPDYWWHTFILLIGCILTLMYSVGDR